VFAARLLSLGRNLLKQAAYQQAQPLIEESLILARQAKNKHLLSARLYPFEH
jgi:hypothetical protein